MDDLITVIINVYNNEKFIGKCLESIINQTYKNLEILVINDGSTDNTLKICESYKDKRIRIITTENKGLSLSRNIGIENSKGEYLYFIDSDDFVENDVIEYLYNLCKKYNTKFSTCSTNTIFNYDFVAKEKKEKLKLMDSIEMLKKVLVSENCAGTIWNKLIKKELFDGIRFENRIINDTLITYKIVIKAEKLVFSNQRKYYWVKHRSSITVSGYKNYNRSIDYYNAILERYEIVKNLYPNLIENEIGVLRGILKLYLYDNEKLQTYLKEKKAIRLFKKLFSLKMLFSNIQIKEKTKLILFAINPQLYIKTGKFYREKKYEYTM